MSEKKTDYKVLYKELLEKFQNQQREIEVLKETIGGYKTSNNRYKKANEELKARLDDTVKSYHNFVKAHDKEQGEQKHENDRLKKLLCEEKNLKTEAERTMLFYKENYNYFKSLPWYKRLFVK